MVVEFDGRTHSEPKKIEQDRKRDALICGADILVLRVASENDFHIGAESRVVKLHPTTAQSDAELFVRLLIGDLVSELESEIAVQSAVDESVYARTMKTYEMRVKEAQKDTILGGDAKAKMLEDAYAQAREFHREDIFEIALSRHERLQDELCVIDEDYVLKESQGRVDVRNVVTTLSQGYPSAVSATGVLVHKDGSTTELKTPRMLVTLRLPETLAHDSFNFAGMLERAAKHIIFHQARRIIGVR
jgi:hypothetical protein